MNKATAAKHASILWAGPDQAEELARLHAPLFDQPWNVASFHELLAHPGATSFLARTGSPPETAGFILGRLAADEAEILTVGVCKDWQRMGIGRRLVEAMARAAKKAEAHRLHLEVSVTNAPALLLYKRLGFQECGRRKSYYERPGAAPEDAINLALPL
jgi:[ribosomal protein S18]-alanine N-acetyltransferase